MGGLDSFGFSDGTRMVHGWYTVDTGMKVFWFEGPMSCSLTLPGKTSCLLIWFGVCCYILLHSLYIFTIFQQFLGRANQGQTKGTCGCMVFIPNIVKNIPNMVNMYQIWSTISIIVKNCTNAIVRAKTFEKLHGPHRSLKKINGSNVIGSNRIK